MPQPRRHRRSGARLELFVNGELRSIKPHGRFDCNDGTVLHEWALAGRGLAWRSMWKVGDDLSQGRLVEVLADYAAPGERHLRIVTQTPVSAATQALFVEFLKRRFGNPLYCQQAS